ncbi:MAG: RNA-binding protein [Bdellovibrionales bacterium]|nr:RNA-binding protein [Bdellovibrionales bacterium]
MNNKLYIGQLAYAVSSEELGEFFASVGEVLSAKVITDRDSGRSKGFGFVEMQSESLANEAIEKLNGQALMGRNITVSVARPQEPRSGGGGRGGFGGDRRGGNGGGGGGNFRGGGRGGF